MGGGEESLVFMFFFVGWLYFRFSEFLYWSSDQRRAIYLSRGGGPAREPYISRGSGYVRKNDQSRGRRL